MNISDDIHPYKIHFCKFLKWQPSGILSISYSLCGTRLAIARDNGNIEIYKTYHGMIQKHLITIYGSKNIIISCIEWTEDNDKKRLFISSLNGTIYEIDFNLLNMNKNICHSYGGAIWCMKYNKSKDLIAIGCEDGKIRFYNLLNDSLYLSHSCITTGSRIISLIWNEEGHLLYSGSINGIIYKWDTISGRNINRITLNHIDNNIKTNNNNNTIIWSLALLQDNTLFSSDSNGYINRWETHTGSLIQSFKNSDTDILCIKVNKNNNKLFAAGINGSIIKYERINSYKWNFSKQIHPHTHDIRSIDLYNDILISGGLDTNIIQHNLNNFGKLSKKDSYPNQSIISLSIDKHILLLQNNDSLDIYTFNNNNNKLNNNPNYAHLFKLNISNNNTNTNKISSNIISSNISNNGTYIACSTNNDIKLFKISYLNEPFNELNNNNNTNYNIIPKKIKLNHQIHEYISNRVIVSLIFSIDSNYLFLATNDHKIIKICLLSYTIESILEEKCSKDDLNTNSIHNLSYIKTIAINHTYLATGNSINNNISIYNIKENTFLMNIPSFHVQLTSIQFHPKKNLVLVTGKYGKFYFYDYINHSLSNWTRNHIHFLKDGISNPVQHILGSAFNPFNLNELFLYTRYELIKVDLSLDTNHSLNTMDHKIINHSKRKRKYSITNDTINDEIVPNKHNKNNNNNSINTSQNNEVDNHNENENDIENDYGNDNDYENIDENNSQNNRLSVIKKKKIPFNLFTSFIGNNEFVIVSRPWKDIMEKLPKMIYRHKYGS